MGNDITTGLGFDGGTAWLVAARKIEEQYNLKAERNCFLDLDKGFEDMISSSSYNYIKDVEDGEEKIFVVGKDALVLANLYAKNSKDGERKSHLRRPMQKMVINSSSDKKAIQILKYLIQSLAGKPKYPGETAVISVPSDPCDMSFNTIFHSNMCQSFLRELGYDVYPINEGLCIVYASGLSSLSEDNEVLPMTGIGLSFGCGGINGCLAFKGADIVKFSLPKSGDFIDESVSQICNLSVSEVTVEKEKLSKDGKLDLINPDFSNDVLSGLYIYYNNLIEMVVRQFKTEFAKTGTHFNSPISVALSGGASKPKGFEELVEKKIKEIGWPFDIKSVKRVEDPLSATAIGAYLASASREKKKQNV